MLIRLTQVALIVLGLAAPAWAEVSRLEVQSREQPALGGRSFATGQAEKITARATLSLAPTPPQNGVIKDLELAPRNGEGRVEAGTDVVILRLARPNGILLFEVLNRGRKLPPSWVQDTDTAAGIRLATPEDAGNEFLLDEGYTLVWAGWQPDAPPGPGHLLLQVPTAPVLGLSHGVLPLPAHADPADPRPALDQLYPTPAAYLAAVQDATAELVASRLLLPRGCRGGRDRGAGRDVGQAGNTYEIGADVYNHLR